MVDPGVRKPVWNVDADYPVDKGKAIVTRNRESPDHLYDSGIFFCQVLWVFLVKKRLGQRQKHRVTFVTMSNNSKME